MGQIVGLKAKPKRCNLNKLSQLGIPAAGEYILVSYDNSMNAAGQGNFDCYIVGDGTKAATALELKSVDTFIGAFDISAYHATGGVLAKYADLTAALNDGNNIPQYFRKGGMSVKFVQSSDNKYVEYFLPKNEWSINEADWQKLNLEEEVIQVGQKVDDVDKELHGLPEILITDFSGYKVYDGTIVSGVFHNSGVYGTRNKYILVPMAYYKGKAVVFTPNSAGTMITMLANSILVDGTTASFATGWTGLSTPLTSQTSVNVPSDCEYLMVIIIQSLEDKTPISLRLPAVDKIYYNIDEIDAITGETKQSVALIESLMPGKTQRLSLESGYAINVSDGEISASTTFSYVKDYIPISDEPTITIKVNGDNAVVSLRFYDENKDYIGYSYSSAAKFVRSNYKSLETENVELYLNGDLYLNVYKELATEDEVLSVEQSLSEVNDVLLDKYNVFSVSGKIIGTGGSIGNSEEWSYIEDYFPIDSDPVVNMRVNGDSVATGKRYYDVNREYIGYTYTASAKFVRINFKSLATTNLSFTLNDANYSVNGSKYIQPVSKEDWQGLRSKFPNVYYGSLLREKCPNFYSMFRKKDKDVVVCITGTSLTQGNLYASVRNDATTRPPLLHTNDLASHIWDALYGYWGGQYYRRYDHSDIQYISGTWSVTNDAKTNNVSIWDDAGNSKNGLTKTTLSSSAAISIIVPDDAWQFNFIYRTDSEGGVCTIDIDEGNNKMEVWNGTAWVEANGYQFTMLEPAATATKGNTCYQKRLKMRCKNKASGGINSIGTTKTLTISKGNDSSRFNVVGFEWSKREFMLTLINAARGGHCWGYNTALNIPSSNNLENTQDSDIWEFSPDLILSEVTAINWGAGSSSRYDKDCAWWVNMAKRYYFNEFNDDSISLYEKSNRYTDCEIIFYGDTHSVAAANANAFDSDGQPIFGTVTVATTNGASGDSDSSQIGRVRNNFDTYDEIDKYMAGKTEYIFIPATTPFKELAIEYFGNYVAGFTPSGATGKTFSTDGTHLNDNGAAMWAALIVPLFKLL